MPSNENGITNGVNGHAHTNGHAATNGYTHTNGHGPTNGHAHTTPGPSPSPIAIVGMACRFAGGATSPEKLWELCATGRDAWSRIPKSRFDVDSLYNADKDKPGRNHATGGYFLEEDVSLFDAAFFNFTAAVANAMDPQLRLLLEVVYEATEDAGIPIEKLAGPESSTSVFTGCYTKDYHDLLTRDPETMPPATLTGNYTAMFSNRLSHYYDFQGASMSIDTGCSAALAALHQGCQTIRSGDSKVSIIGASNTILNPDIYIAMSSLGMVGAEGRCYAWDTRAEGYGRGEGVAVLVLKSLDDALRDGDQVHAVIRNSALNQDGNTTTITSPSLEAQVRLIQDCYRRARLDISETGYVEAHMTGTQAGDATEAESLARTFGSSRSDGDAVWIGGVKTNVGHTEGVSGLAGIIKAAMAMKYQAIPPNLNYKVGNRKIPLQDWNLQVPTSLVDWPKDKPLRASINNFGYGGTNAHVILDGIAEQTQSGTSLSITPANGSEVNISRLYILSAQDATTTKNMAKNLAAYLRQSNSVPSAKDLAFTLAERRSRLSWVATVRARSIPELADQLENDALQVAFAPAKRQSPRLGFVFNGQGAQWHAMGRELLHEYPVFAASVEAADEVLREHGATWSLIEELTRDAKSTRVSEIHLGQPITVALQICLVDLLHSWGIYPSAVTSHSSGEIAAAYAAGLLSFEQALGVTYWRGELARLMLGQEDSGLVGGMAAAGLSPDEAQGYLSKTSSGGRVVVACVNSPESVTLSGDLPDLEEVVARVEADGRFARKLKVPVAYHSHHMQVMAAAYTKKLQDLVPSWSEWPRPHVLYTSPVTGGIISSPEALAPTHYVNNLTNPVLFSQAFEAMCFGSSATNVDAVVEIGPHGTLAGPIRQILQGRKMPYVSCLKRPVDSVETMQDMAANLIRLGYPVHLGAVNHPVSTKEEGVRRFIPGLPTYPWNHSTSYWAESRVNHQIRYKPYAPHELLGLPISGAATLTWRNFLRLSDLPWMGDHRVDGAIVLPGAAYASMAIEAVRLVKGEVSIHGYRLRDLEFLSALTIPEIGGSSSSIDGVEMHFSLLPLQDEDGNEVEGWYRFSVRSLGGNGTWAENSRGLVSVVTEAEDVDEALIPDQESFLQGRCSAEKLEGSAVRARVAEMGVEYGPAFHGLVDSNAAAASGALPRAVANLRLNSLGSLEESEADDPNTTSYVIHPTTLDCIVQATYSNLPRGTGKMAMVLPRFIEEMFIPQLLNREIGESLTVFSELRKTESTGFASNVSIVNTMDQEEKYGGPLPLMEISRLFCQAIPRVRAIEDDGPGVRLWDTRWEQDVWHDGIPASIKDSMRVTLDNEDAAWEKKLVKASYHLIHDAVTILEGPNLTQEAWTPDRRVLFSWMKTIVEQGKAGTLAPGSKLWQRSSKGVKQILFDELQAKGGTHGNLLIRVGQQLGAIVRGDIITPHEALKKEDEAGDLRVQYHQDLSGLRVRSGTHLGKLVRSFAVIKPGLKVLEVSAGDGTLAQTILKSSGNHGDGTSLIDQYILTNSTSALFDAAKQKLTAWEEAVKYRELDFEDGQAISKISSELKADVIVASLFQLQFSNFEATLNNVRSLLNPGGKLLLVEPTQGRLDMQLMVKALALTETKTEYPMSLLAWDEKLKTNQFTGLELTVDDCEQQQHRGFSVFLTSAAPPTKNGAVNGVDGKLTASLILHPSSFPSVSQQPWVSRVIEAVQARTGLKTVVESFDLAQPDDKKVALLATDLEGETLLDSLDETQFSQLRQILLGSRGVLWVTSSGGTRDDAAPGSAQVKGLLRTLRQEDTDRAYGLLDLPRNWTTSAKSDIGAVGIARVLQKILHEDTSEAADWEYALGDDGSFYLPRVHPVQVHENATSETKPGLSVPFQSSEHSLVWNDAASSFIGKLRQQEAKETPAGMIEIDVKAFSPRHPPKTANDENAATLYEASGVVVGLGNNTEASGLQLGDNVCGLAAPGTRVASTVRAPWTTITRVPDGISLETVACMPLAYATAYHALVHVARLQDKDKVMILHAIENLDSEATIGLAAQMGAEVSIVTHNGSDSDAIQLSEHYHIPMERILIKPSTKTLNEVILGQTNGLGVDVLVNAVSLPKSQLKFGRLGEDIIARFGRVVDLGGAQSHELDVKQFAARCASYARVDVIQLAQHNGKVMKQALDAAFQFLSRSNTASLTPPSLSGVAQYPVSELKDALEFTQEKHVPVLVVPKPESVVKVLPPSHSISLTYEDGTYLVCGGVGGIGSTIAMSMVSKGARNVIVVSRNAESHPATEFLAEDARQKGCHLEFVNCDVSDEQSVISLVNRISASSPPIRGAVHAAAVLEDTIFEQMTFAQWQSALKPKVAGARNLHRHLPSDLSFFVLLSSITGVVGHPSQANYAAANTFEDALVRERAAQGLAGISLDLPAITGAGMVGDNAEAHRRVEALGTESMPIDKALDLIETAILRDVDRQWRQSQAHLNHETSASDGEVVQLIAGLQPWSLLSPDATVRRDKRFGTLRLMGSTSASASDDPSSAGSISDPTTLLIQALSRSKDENDAGAKDNAVVDALAARLAAIFSMPVETIDLGLTIAGHGVDSLVAVDLRNWLASAGKAKLSIFDILQSPSLKHLAGLVVGKSGLSK